MSVRFFYMIFQRLLIIYVSSCDSHSVIHPLITELILLSVTLLAIILEHYLILLIAQEPF